MGNSTLNLFTKHSVRAALADEIEEGGPEVALVCLSFAFARKAERLAGAAAGPDGPVGWPSGESQGKRPSANSGEKVALGVSKEVGWFNICNRALINITRRNQSISNQLPEPRCHVRVKFIVVIHFGSGALVR
jgi:hypothetical protein